MSPEYGVVVFSASWCPPCRRMKDAVWPGNRVKRAIAVRPFKMYNVDFDKQKDLVQAYRVTAVPTIVVIKTEDGVTREVARNVGGMSVQNTLQFLQNAR